MNNDPRSGWNDANSSPSLIPLVIGVTGNLDPVGPPEVLRERLRALFRFFKHGARAESGHYLEEMEALLFRKESAHGLENWPGVGERVPLHLLSSMARGCDTLAAEVALEDEFVGLGFELRCPLAFPPEVYRTTSSFVDSTTGKPSTEDKARQDRFDELCGRARDVFTVRQQRDIEELGLDPEAETALLQRCKKESGLDESQHHRFRSASDYLAASSHILIAVYDDQFRPEGRGGSTDAVEAMRAGVQPGLLPAAGDFNWTESGPVFHLYHPRQKNAGNHRGQDFQERPLRILHPNELSRADPAITDQIAYSWEPGTSIHDATAWRDWQNAGNDLTVRIAWNLKEFNQQIAEQELAPDALAKLCVAPFGRQAAEGERETPGSNPCLDEFENILPMEAKEHARSLDCFAKIQSSASLISAEVRRERERTHRHLFQLALCAALSLLLFSHWHSQSQAEEHGGANLHEVTICGQPIFGFLALTFAIGGLVLFGRHRSRRSNELAHDSRAISEGLRVQFYWCLAGLRRSVAANYMHRQRTEMDWIRNAISALSAPIERWQQKFLKLSALGQHRVFRMVRDAWIESQASSHAREARTREEQFRIWHTLGGLLALAGLCQVPFLLAASIVSGFPSDTGHWTLGFSFCVVGAACLVFKTVLAGMDEENSPLRGSRDENGRTTSCFVRLIDLLVPKKQGNAHNLLCLTPDEREKASHSAFLAYCPAALGIALFLLGTCLLLPGIGTWLPTPIDLAFITAGFCLVSGALAAGWTGKSLLRERFRQSHAMASLHAASLRSMDEGLLNLREAIKSRDDEALHAARERIHDLLFALGKEALDENSQWLALYRTRPTGPGMTD